ncbi:MAG: hypothetical protein R2690_06310 [Acidimicrobiales bacterium]
MGVCRCSGVRSAKRIWWYVPQLVGERQHPRVGVVEVDQHPRAAAAHPHAERTPDLARARIDVDPALVDGVLRQLGEVIAEGGERRGHLGDGFRPATAADGADGRRQVPPRQGVVVAEQARLGAQVATQIVEGAVDGAEHGVEHPGVDAVGDERGRAVIAPPPPAVEHDPLAERAVEGGRQRMRHRRPRRHLGMVCGSAPVRIGIRRHRPQRGDGDDRRRLAREVERSGELRAEVAVQVRPRHAAGEAELTGEGFGFGAHLMRGRLRGAAQRVAVGVDRRRRGSEGVEVERGQPGVTAGREPTEHRRPGGQTRACCRGVGVAAVHGDLPVQQRRHDAQLVEHGVVGIHQIRHVARRDVGTGCRVSGGSDSDTEGVVAALERIEGHDDGIDGGVDRGRVVTAEQRCEVPPPVGRRGGEVGHAAVWRVGVSVGAFDRVDASR